MASISEAAVKAAFGKVGFRLEDAEAVTRALAGVQQQGLDIQDLVTEYDTVSLTK